MSEIKIVIGSWGSYNECNERALGSKWLDLSDYSNWEEIEEELTKEGFELDGLDEELFIQDIEGIPSNSCNWDYTHPKTIFELLQEADVIDDTRKYDLMSEYLTIRTWSDFEDLVSSKGYRWDDDIIFYENYDWSDYGKNYYDNCCYNIPTEIENFIDFEAYGQYIGSGYAEETENGIMEIIR